MAFDLEDPFFDQTVPIDVSSMSSRVRGLSRIGGGSAERLLASGSDEQLQYAFFGSPAMNAQGEVVAVYSRPTPPSPDTDDPQPVETFDAPLFARVHECLAE